MEVSASENDILKINDFAQGVYHSAGYLPADSNIIQLVLEEVLADIVESVYPDRPQSKIQLEISIGKMGLRVHITEQGKACDFKGMKNPDLNHFVELVGKNTWGLWFTPKMTVKICYQTHSDHNEWILYYRPSEIPSGDVVKKKKKNGFSFKFVFACFVFFSFLLFLVYALSCLIVLPTNDINDLVVSRITEGAKTTLGRGILLVYGMGLMGFFIIFYKLNPFRRSQGADSQNINSEKSPELSVKDQKEYERLVRVISDMDEQLRESERKIADQEGAQLEMRIIENARQEELRSQENAKSEERKLIENTTNQEVTADENSREKMEQLSHLKDELDKQLKEAQLKIADKENAQTSLIKEVKPARSEHRTIIAAELPQVEGFQIGVSFRAGKDKGKNFYDFIWVDPVTLGVAVGDVRGNDIADHAVVPMIRSAIRLEARENKLPVDVLLKVHQHLNNEMGSGVFAGVLYMVLDSVNHSVSIADAGQKSIIFYRKSSNEVFSLKSRGFPLGTVLPDFELLIKTLGCRKVNLQKDDILIAFTDGVIHSLNPAGEIFGMNRLTQAVQNNAHLAVEELIRKLETKIADFTAGAEQNDDMTLLAVKGYFQSEEATYKLRKNLLNLVEKDGLSIVEACRKTRVSPQTYDYYKNIYDKKGDAGLKPNYSIKGDSGEGLSEASMKAVISVVKSYPELEPDQIVAFLKNNFKPSLRLDIKLVADFLFWEGLDDSRARKLFAAGAIDTV